MSDAPLPAEFVRFAIRAGESGHHLSRLCWTYKVMSRTLKKKVRVCETRIRKLEEHLAALKASNHASKGLEKSAVDTGPFLSLMRCQQLNFDVKTITTTLLKRAETIEDVRLIISKTRTFSRARSKICKEAQEKRLRFYLDAPCNVNRILPNRTAIINSADYLSVVFGKNVLKHVSETMVFYHMPLREDLKDFKVRIAHFDGKFSGCPKGFNQSVELRLLLQHQDREVTITFARALLRGCRIENYVEFFSRVRNANVKKIPHIMTDFEIAVRVAVKETFPSAQVRGCWYHFWNNLLCHSGKLKRFTGQTPNARVIRLLTLMPFFHRQEIFFCRLLRRLAIAEDQVRFKDVNYKVLMYVYTTYSKRFSDIFFMDLGACITRTNNSCEGSNSGLAKFSAKRLELREFIDYVELGIKKDAVKQVRPLRPLNNTDRSLLAIQKASSTNADELFETLWASSEVEKFQLDQLLGNLPKFPKVSLSSLQAESEVCQQTLEAELTAYRAFKVLQRGKWETRKSNDRQFDVGERMRRLDDAGVKNGIEEALADETDHSFEEPCGDLDQFYHIARDFDIGGEDQSAYRMDEEHSEQASLDALDCEDGPVTKEASL
jgi:hypothetical protein